MTKHFSKQKSDTKLDRFDDERPSSRFSLGSSTSSTFPRNGTNPTFPSKDTKNPFGRFGANEADYHSWNPFAINRVASSSRISLTKKETSINKFMTLSDLTAYLHMMSEDYLAPYMVKELCQQIVDFMNMDDEDPELQTHGAKALFLLSLQDNSDHEGKSFTKPGVHVILGAMENFPNNAELQYQSCVTLESLLAWEENQAIVLYSRGQIDALYSAMESFADYTELNIASLGALYHLSCHPDAVEPEMAKDLAYAIPPILELLVENRDHVDIYERGMSTLAKLTEDNSESQLLFCHDGQLGIRIAVDALHNETFLDRPKIQLAAMLVLQHVASHSSLECKGRIVYYGGLDRILDTLQQHSAIVTQQSGKRSLSTQILASGLHSIANLSASTLNNKTWLRMGKAVPIMLEILKAHPTLSEIQTSGYSALANLADVYTSVVTQNDGIAIIMRSMAEQINNPAVQKQACRALVQLFSKRQNDANSTNNLLSGENNPSAAAALDVVRAIAEENGIEIIFRAVRLHQSRRPVQEPAIEALYYLSCSRDLTVYQKKQLCLEENVVVLLGTIRNYIESETICERGCGLVLNMSFFDPLRQESMAEGKFIIGQFWGKSGWRGRYFPYFLFFRFSLCILYLVCPSWWYSDCVVSDATSWTKCENSGTLFGCFEWTLSRSRQS
jgi:hypothetical protein